jgi:hypothetical protein
MLGVTSAIAGATLIGLGAAGTTYALWQAEAPLNASTVTSGSLELKVNNQTSFDVADLDMTQLLPGRTIVSPTPLLLQNTGTVAMDASISSIGIVSSSPDLASSLQVVLRQGTMCSALEDGGSGAGPEFAGLIRLAAGQESSYCLEVTLSSSAPSSVQGATADLSVNLAGVQVRQ